MAYSVELDIYCGPLDLLLYLVQQEEVDVYDIPIARILERYIEHLENVKHIDINLAAEFLVMASHLMEIKSKLLLPAEDRPPENEEDPRSELVRQLLAYRAFKEAATRLGEYRDARARRYSRGRPVQLPDPSEPEAGLEETREVSLFDLADGYADLVKATGGARTATIIYDEIPMEARISAIIEALRRRDEFALRALLSERASRIELVGTFFALLELVKEGQVRVYQNLEFGEIIVKRREGEGEGEVEPAGPYVAPHLPPAREMVQGKDGSTKFTGPRRSRFAGLEGREDGLEAGEFDFGEEPDGAREEDEFRPSDERERRLNRRIDAILFRADEISTSFEQSRAGRRREEARQDVSSGLAAAMAAFEADLGPGEAGGDRENPGMDAGELSGADGGPSGGDSASPGSGAAPAPPPEDTPPAGGDG